MADKRNHEGKSRARRAKRRPRQRLYHPGPLIADETNLREAAEALRRKDPELVEKLIAVGGLPPLRRRDAGFAGLAAIIVSQQVSVASAKAIFGRLETRIFAARLRPPRCRDRGGIARLRALRAENSRSAGFGGVHRRRPARSDGPRRSGRGTTPIDALVSVKRGRPLDRRYISALLSRPSGRFSRGRSRLAGGGELALNLKTRPDARRLERIAERWRPWRGVAARMLWAYYRGVQARSGMALADRSG